MEQKRQTLAGQWYNFFWSKCVKTHLLGGVGKVGLVLRAAGDGVVGNGTLEALAGGITAGGGVGLGDVAVNADGGLGGLRAGLAGGAADGAGTLGDRSVGGVEVGRDGRVFGLGEAGDALGDQVGLALGVGVDDGLGLGGVGVGGDVAAVRLGGLGLRLTDVLLGHVEGAVRHVGGLCGWWLRGTLDDCDWAAWR
jgi:hypothetical protein